LLLIVVISPAFAQDDAGDAVPGPDQSPHAARAAWLAGVKDLKVTVEHIRAEAGQPRLVRLSAAPLTPGAVPPGHARVPIEPTTARSLVAWLAGVDIFATAHTQKEAQVPIGPTSYRIVLMGSEQQVAAIYSKEHALAMLCGLRAVLAGGGPAQAPKDWRTDPKGGLLCAKCKGMMFIMSVGKCSSCGGHTSSGAHKLCSGCSARQGKCKACGKKLPTGGNAHPVGAIDRLMQPLAKVRKEVDGTVEKLIGQLGDDDYRTRKRASKALAKLGYAASDKLRAALKRDGVDLETRGRIEELLAEMPTVSLSYGREVMTDEGITIRIAGQLIEALNAEGKIMWRSRLGQESEALKLTDKGVVVEPSGAILEPKTGRLIQVPNVINRRRARRRAIQQTVD